MNPIADCGSYINGQFQMVSKAAGERQNLSPADLADQVFRFSWDYAHIDAAVAAAREAFPVWSELRSEERLSHLKRLAAVYSERKEELAVVIARETGKPLWESRGEVATMINKIDITLNHSLKRVAEEKIVNALPQIDGFIRYKPRGVMAVIGPFNFPGHLPNGHIVPALATGNTVVFKPSDLTPATGQLMAEMIHQAKFPSGVFNLIQGDGEVGRRLSAHEHVDGVLFTGSYDVGLKIKQETLHHYWKILALEMGGKNTSIIWEDADLDKALYETIIGCFVTAGQRCSCTSRVILHAKIAEPFLERFYKTAKKLVIGHWQENPFMGPLISKAAVEKYVRFQDIAKREGAEVVMRGKALDLPRKGYYVTPSIYRVQEPDAKSVYQCSEIFGPNVAVYTTDDYEAALEITNSSGYGLVMSVFTKNRALYERALQRARVGLVNWNRTTNGASSKLPFGGMGKSGNDRPSAEFAVHYCTVPVASLEDTLPLDTSNMLPGIELGS